MAYYTCLMGASLETGNMGVSALAVSLVKNIIEARADAKISFLIGNRVAKEQKLFLDGRKVNVQIVNYRLSPRARMREQLIWIFLMAFLHRLVPISFVRNLILKKIPFLNSISQARFIGDIHGGDSFSDIYGFGRFIIGVIPNLIVFLMQKKLILLPQTYGPYKSSIAARIAKHVMNHSYKILSRDLEGIDVIKKLANNSHGEQKLSFCPDVAFTLDTAKVDHPHIEPQLETETNKSIFGLNVNGLMYNGGYTLDNMFGLKFNYKEFVQNMVKRLDEETQVNLLLIPHVFGPPGNTNSDPDAIRKIVDSLEKKQKTRIYIIRGQYDQSEIKQIIGLCDFFVGSRMHACIAALSQGIPTIGVAYSRKFRGVFKSIGMDDMVIDARFVDENSAVNKILDRYSNRINIKRDLKASIQTIQKQVQVAFKNLTNDII